MLFEELGEVLHVQHTAVLIDADPQASLTASFGIRNADTLDTTLTNVYTIEGNTSDSCAERW